MARITFSPLVVEASGKVKDTVFSKWKGRNYIRARVTPANPQSAGQTAVRESLARCVTLWQSLVAPVPDIWDTYASPYSLSGYNSFVGANRSAEQAGTDLLFTPHNANVEKQTSLSAATGGASGEIDLTWTGGKTGADIYCAVWTREDGENVFEKYDLNTTLNSVGSKTLSGLTASTAYDVFTFVWDENITEGSESQTDSATSGA